MATNYTYEIKYGVVRITHCESDEEEIKVPSKIDGKNVYQICSFSFYELDCKRIILPKSIGKIEDSAFFNLHNLEYFECSHIEDMYYPFATDVSNLEVHTSSYFVAKKFKKYSDSNIYKFRKINYDNTFSYKVLDKAKKTAKITKFNIFDKDVVFPDEIDGYKIIEIYGKITEDVQSVKLPKYLEKIPQNFLTNQPNVVKVIFPKYLKSIGKNAFKNTMLENLFIPETVDYIGDNAFYIETPMTLDGTISFKNKKQKEFLLGCGCFVNRNVSIDKTTILNIVSSEDVFCGAKIDNLYFANIKNIPSRAFKKAIIGHFFNSDMIESLGEEAFYDCKFIYEKKFDLKNAFYAGKNCFSASNIDEVYIGKNLELSNSMFSNSTISTVIFAGNYNKKVIPCRCFSNTFNLFSIKLPSSIKVIQMEAFLESAIYFINLKNVTEIHMCAFSNCTNLVKAEFKSLHSLDISSFCKCTFLKEVYFYDSVIDTIGSYAFFGCEKLEKVVLSSKTLNILKNSFMNCRSLKNINLDGIKYIADEAFCRCGFEKISLDNIEQMKEYVFSECYYLTDVYLGKYLTNLPKGCFSLCEKLENINIDNIFNFGDFCLYHTAIKEIHFPRKTSFIGNGVITQSLVEKVYVSSSYIDSRAFIDLMHLKEIYFEYVGYVNTELNNSPLLERVVLGEKSSKIANGSFYCLPNLKEFCIKRKHCSIGGKNFSKCPNLTTLYFNDIDEFKIVKKRRNFIKKRKDVSEFV